MMYNSRRKDSVDERNKVRFWVKGIMNPSKIAKEATRQGNDPGEGVQEPI